MAFLPNPHEAAREWVDVAASPSMESLPMSTEAKIAAEERAERRERDGTGFGFGAVLAREAAEVREAEQDHRQLQAREAAKDWARRHNARQET